MRKVVKKNLVLLLLFSSAFVLGIFLRFLPGGKLIPNIASNQLVQEMIRCEVFEYSDSDFTQSKRRNCYNTTIFAYLRKNSLKETIAGLDEYMKTDQGKYLVGTRCHDIGHGLGIESVKLGYTPREILETCNTTCGGGCLNGAGHLFVTIKKDNQSLDSFCNIDNVSKTVRDMCFHGIGHGLMEYYTLDISTVIKNCQTIQNDSDKFQCGHAAFMDTSMVKLAPLSKVPKDLNTYCGALENVLKYSCFQFGGFLTYVRDKNINEAFDFCMATPDYFQRLCISRIGESSYLATDGDGAKTAQMCKRADEEQFRHCLKGANIFSVNSPDSSFGTRARAICLETSGNVRAGCLSDLGAIIVRTYSNKQLEDFCLVLEDPTDRMNCKNINEPIINEPDFER